MVSLNYRLAPGALWPAQIEDCKAAIRWLKAHAEQYGYDPNRIGVIGESAGAQLVAILCTTSGTKKFDTGENLDRSSDVSCAVDLFGPTDFTAPEMGADEGAIAIFGGPIKEHMDAARAASPIYYIHPNQPPILVIQGTFNATRTNFEGTGGGIGLFEDPMVEPLIFGFFRHYLLENKKDLFTGVGVSATQLPSGSGK